MSETTETQNSEVAATPEGAGTAVQLEGLFAFKVGMSAVFEEGERIPVTVLK